MSFMRRLMNQRVGSTFIPFEEIFYTPAIAITLTAPTGCDTANIRMWGGGGGGGDNNNGSTTAGSGGGGGFTIKTGLSVSGGSSAFTCTVGAGGTGGVNTSGGAGGNTTITGAITISANGGGGGLRIGTGGSGGTTTGGDAESEAGTAGGNDGGAGGDAGGQIYGGGQGGDGITEPTAPGGGGIGTSVDAGEPGARGLTKIKWTKSNGSNTAVYTIYNIPLTFTTTAAPTYATCSIQQTYTTTTTRTLWEDGTYRLASCQFVRAFTANNTTNTCDYDQTNSSFTVGIIQSISPYSQIAQDFFTSVITPSGVELNTADATGWALSGNTTVWFWYNVPNDLFTAGTNVNVRFKV